MLLGGEAVTESVWSQLRDTDGVTGYNLYGPTEYTINTLGGGTDDSATPTVGTPILEHPRLHPRRLRCAPCPPGVAGRAVHRRAPGWPAATSTGRG